MPIDLLVNKSSNKNSSDYYVFDVCHKLVGLSTVCPIPIEHRVVDPLIYNTELVAIVIVFLKVCGAEKKQSLRLPQLCHSGSLLVRQWSKRKSPLITSRNLPPTKRARAQCGYIITFRGRSITHDW